MTRLLLLWMFWIPMAVQASWLVNPKNSIIQFDSTKILKTGKKITEPNTLSSVKGRIDQQGRFDIDIDLDSLETHIPIRNDRVKKYFFHTERQRYAKIRGELSPKNLKLLNSFDGEVTTTQAFTLNINGVQLPVTGEFIFNHTDKNTSIQSSKPIVLSIQDLHAESGLYKLIRLAGLDTISFEVPVKVNLDIQSL